MIALTAMQARAKLYKLLDEVTESHRPVFIIGKRSNAVLVAEDDWRALQETVYLLGIPGMRQSISEGLSTPLNECTEDVFNAHAD